MSALNFMIKELNGFEAQLEAAKSTPCKSGKSHNYVADPKALVCGKCGFDRSNYTPLPKKTKEEIAIMVEQLRRIIAEAEKV